ncbi:MAG TPA: carbonic anhydrase [Mycobacterium sp.]|nr:MAG: carbonic anhydrase [Mycobacterium sp.]HMZ15659.1 carbonic anhydrase [Mycobacterium sp.]HNA50642.1 carbonic anhydrase [Mycobacterium sp.]HNP11607.1 carbonic anhydrase [Mycobacterium sp.]HRD13347.1 carbonic anhydrase [Mycobacterium sp.]
MDGVLSRRAWLGAAGATAAAAALSACGSSTHTESTTTVTVPAGVPITTERSRPDITDPDTALAKLKKGNGRFVTAQMLHPDQGPQTRLRLSQAQKPFAVVLSCSDSRLPPEVIFDQGLGDLFVIRVAGNVVDPAGLGSIEYAVGHLGTPLVMVMGHENCGAVSATLEALQPPFDQPHGAVASLITAITPAVAVAEQQQGDLLVNAIRANALQSREEIMKSHELEGPLGSGALKVVTSYYNLQDGTVSII